MQNQRNGNSNNIIQQETEWNIETQLIKTLPGYLKYFRFIKTEKCCKR